MDSNKETAERYCKHSSRKKMLPIVLTYAMGAFNDNFFKQAISLIAVYSAKESMQGAAAIAFAIPWLFCAAPAGWFADRYKKKNVIIAAKGLELIAMLSGAAGIIFTSWTLILIMLFIMGLQSTLFSPAINGSIPELYPPKEVIKVNGLIKMFVNIANISGIILAGILLNVKTPVWNDVTLGRFLIGGGIILIAIIGFIFSFRCESKEPSDGHRPFPWAGPVDTVRELCQIAKKDKLLWLINVGDALAWLVAVWQILTINQLGKAAFDFNEQQTSYLLLPELLGIGVGGVVAAKIVKGSRWYTKMPPTMLLMAVFLGGVALAGHLPDNLQLYAIVPLLFLACICGGVLLIPMESFFQTRPVADRKGTVIAAANFMSFLGIIGAGVLDIGFNKFLPMAASENPPHYRFFWISLLALVTAGWLSLKVRKQKTLSQDDTPYE